MPLRRTIHTDLQATLFGPMRELCPDVTIQRQMLDTESGAMSEVDPEDIYGLVFMTEQDGAIIIVLDPNGKAELMKLLTGGVQIAGAGELNKLGGI